MRSIIFLLLSLTTLSHPVRADQPSSFVEKPVTPATIQQLRAGGYILYMRHGKTDVTKTDRVPSVDFNDCATQRPLSKEGWLEVAQIGEAVRKAGIPVGEIISSPMCRAKESALAAFGANFTVNTQLAYTGNMTSEQKLPIIDTIRALLSKPVRGKTNRVLVGHAPNLMDLMGYLPNPEGKIVIFKPQGSQGFKYIASIAPQEWSALLP